MHRADRAQRQGALRLSGAWHAAAAAAMAEQRLRLGKKLVTLADLKKKWAFSPRET